METMTPMQVHPTINPIVDGDSPLMPTLSLTGGLVGVCVGFLSVSRGAATETLLSTP